MPAVKEPAPQARRRLPACPASIRLLVAIGLHADEEGLTCRAGNDELAEAAAVTPEELAGALATLIESGWIETLLIPAPHPVAGRVIVLKDHPAATWYLAETRKVLRLAQYRTR